MRAHWARSPVSGKSSLTRRWLIPRDPNTTDSIHFLLIRNGWDENNSRSLSVPLEHERLLFLIRPSWKMFYETWSRDIERPSIPATVPSLALINVSFEGVSHPAEPRRAVGSDPDSRRLSAPSALVIIVKEHLCGDCWGTITFIFLQIIPRER